MTKPWEKYSASKPAPASKPWDKFAAQSEPKGGFFDSVYENIVGRGEVDTPGERLGEMIRGGGAALARGISDIPALPGNVMQAASEFGQSSANNVRGAMGLESTDHVPLISRAVNTIPNSEDTRGALSAVTGGESDYVAPGTAGEYISTAGEFAGSAGAVGGPSSLLKYGAIPGLANEAAGQATEGVTFPEAVPLVGGKDVEPFARTGASLAAPAVAGLAERVGRRMITPNPADPARTAAANKLTKEGIDTTAGQKTGTASLKYREENVPRTQQILADQDEQFTRAALKRIGVDAKRAEPEVMAAASKRIGGMFKDLSKRNDITPDSDLFTSTREVVANYKQLSAKSNIAPIIGNVADDIGRALMSGKPISGSQYQAWRTQLGSATRGTDGQLRDAASGLINALDSAMERTLQAAGRTEDLATYTTARGQWRDYLAIQRAVSSAGTETAMGIINPRQLRGAVAAQSKSQYVRGQRDLGELARSGNIVMSPLPNSGTAQRIGSKAMQAIDGGAGVGVGGLTYAITKDPQSSALLAGLAGLTPVARNALAGTKVGQSYLANQLVGAGGSMVDQRMYNALAALAAQSGN